MGEMKRLFAKWRDNSPAFTTSHGRVCQSMVGHLFQTCGFLPRILAIFSALWCFFPSMCPFYYTKQTRINLRTKRAIYVSQKQTCIYIYVCMYVCVYVCMWGHSRSSYKKHRIIQSARNIFHVPCRRKLTSV